MEESEFVQLMRKKFSKDEMDEEYECKFGFLVNAPEGYGKEKEMLEYAKENPNASMEELLDYFDEITPDGIAENDDGDGLAEDE